MSIKKRIEIKQSSLNEEKDDGLIEWTPESLPALDGHPSRDEEKIQDLKAFSPTQRDAKKDFLRLQKNNVAWYREPSTGVESLCPVVGVLVTEDIIYRGKQGSFILRRGGVLIQSEEKSKKSLIQAIQPEYFKSRFLRCFSDGTEICRLSEKRMDQLMALSKANTQMRKRIQKVSTVGLWKFVVNLRAVSKDVRQMREWNDQIQGHIKDLTLRNKANLV